MNDSPLAGITSVVPISKGGSGASTIDEAIVMLGGIPRSSIGHPNGIAQFGIPLITTAPVDIVTIDGPVSPVAGSTVTYKITNYDTLTTYVLSPGVTRSKDILTYTVPATLSHVMFNINGRNIINPNVPLPNAAGTIVISAHAVATGDIVSATLTDTDEITNDIAWTITRQGELPVQLPDTGQTAMYIVPSTGIYTFEAKYDDLVSMGQVVLSDGITATYVAPIEIPGIIRLSHDVVITGTEIIASLDDMNGIPNGAVKWTVNQMPVPGGNYAMHYTPMIAGPHVIQASYIDTDGYIELPSVTLTAHEPANHAGVVMLSSYTAMTSETITAKVFDLDGIIGSVVWKVNDVIVPNASGSSITYTPTAAGSIKIQALYMDGLGAADAPFATLVATATVNQPGSILLSSTTVQTGTEVIATLLEGNGVKGSVVWKANGIIIPGNGSVVHYIPLASGQITMQAIYTDRAGYASTPVAIFDAIAPGDVAGVVSLSKSTVSQHDTIIARVVDGNGITGPVVWRVNGVTQSGNAQSLSYLAKDVGDIVIQATYTDNAQHPSSPSAILQVLALANTPGKLTLSDARIKLGQSITATLFDSNGISGAVQWSINGTASTETGPVLTCTPAAAGDTLIQAVYTDLLGVTATLSDVVNAYVPVNIVGTITISAASVIAGRTVTATLADLDGVSTVSWTLYDAVTNAEIASLPDSVFVYIFDAPATATACYVKATYLDNAGFNQTVQSETIQVIPDQTPGYITVQASAQAGDVIDVTLTDVDGATVVGWVASAGEIIGTGVDAILTCPDAPDPQTVMITATYTDAKGNPEIHTATVAVDRGQVIGEIIISVLDVPIILNEIRPGDPIKADVIDGNLIAPQTKTWSRMIDGVLVPFDLADYTNGIPDDGLTFTAPATPSELIIICTYTDGLGLDEVVSRTITITDTAVY